MSVSYTRQWFLQQKQWCREIPTEISEKQTHHGGCNDQAASTWSGKG